MMVFVISDFFSRIHWYCHCIVLLCFGFVCYDSSCSV